jgi:hypothetical protein
MSKTFSTIVLTAGIALASAVGIFAQPSRAVDDAGRKFAGERLVYDGKISRMKFTFSVAELTFTATDDPQNDGLLIKAEAVSKGTLLSLFRFSFLQQINSNVDLAGFKATRTDKHDVQKERVRDSEAVFDYQQRRVTFVETDPTDKMRAPRRIASGISDPSYDLVSAIYYLRLQDLAVGKRFELEVSDSGLVYKLPVFVAGRDQQKGPTGKVQCWRLEPDIFGPGKLIEKKGKMVIWITDDPSRIPVLAKINSEYGTLTIKLKEYKKSSPQTEAIAQPLK